MKLDFVVLLRTIIVTAAIMLLLVLDRIWFQLISPDIFFKLLISVFLVGIFIAFVIAVKKDLQDEKKMRDDKYLS